MRRALFLLLPLFVGMIFIAIWQIGAMNAKNKYMKATAVEVAKELVDNRGEYLRESGVTLLEASAGFATGNVIAFCLALWSFKSHIAKIVIYPYAIGLKATPVVALAPVLVTLLGLDYGTKIAASALVCFFPLIVQLPPAMERVPDEIVEMFRAYGASDRDVLIKLRLKSSSHDIFSALKTSSTLSVVGAIVGEFISPGAGIGKLIVRGSANSLAPQMYAATLVAAGIGITLFLCIVAIQAFFIRWQPETI